jgi:hypothetical protein
MMMRFLIEDLKSTCAWESRRQYFKVYPERTAPVDLTRFKLFFRQSSVLLGRSVLVCAGHMVRICTGDRVQSNTGGLDCGTLNVISDSRQTEHAAP